MYERGYALPMYGMKTHTWRHFTEEITLPHGAVPIEMFDGIPWGKWVNVIEKAKELGVKWENVSTHRRAVSDKVGKEG